MPCKSKRAGRRRQVLDPAGSFDIGFAHIELGARHIDPIFLQAQLQVNIDGLRNIPGIDFERLDRELSFVSRPREIIRKLRLQVFSLHIERALLFGEQHRAVFQREPGDLPVQNRLEANLVGGSLDLGLGNVGGTVRRNNDIHSWLSDHNRLQIDIPLPERNDLQADLDRPGFKKRRYTRRFGPMQRQALEFDRQHPPVDHKIPQRGRTTRRAFQFRHDPLPDFLEEPVALQHEHGGHGKNQEQRSQRGGDPQYDPGAAAHLLASCRGGSGPNAAARNSIRV